MSDIAMQPSPTTETTGPFFPSCVVCTICCFLRFGEFVDCSHITYNVTTDRNKALVPANGLRSIQGTSIARIPARYLCYIFQSLLCDTDEENQGTVREWNV